MQTAGARILPEDNEQELSREAVLLQWERKIEQAERRPSRVDPDTEPSRDGSGAAPASAEAVAQEEPRRIGRPAPVVEDATHDGPRRFEQAPAPEAGGRRTITITGHPGPARRRRSVVESQLAQPDRIALWAFLLGLFLVAVAAGTAHA
jgi:hypothetical protein